MVKQAEVYIENLLLEIVQDKSKTADKIIFLKSRKILTDIRNARNELIC